MNQITSIQVKAPDTEAQPPTANQVLEELVQRFAPPADPRFPFHDPKVHAKRRLVTAMLIEAYGSDHPLSQIVEGFRRYEHRIDPSEEYIEEIRELVGTSYERLIDSF